MKNAAKNRLFARYLQMIQSCLCIFLATITRQPAARTLEIGTLLRLATEIMAIKCGLHPFQLLSLSSTLNKICAL
jgi:hypothetical protein